MKADAYAAAERGLRVSKELDLLAKIDRFGAKAILGRDTFYYGELQNLIIAENIFLAYHSRKKSENWVAWAEDNPAIATLLFEAEQLCRS